MLKDTMDNNLSFRLRHYYSLTTNYNYILYIVMLYIYTNEYYIFI